MPIKLDTPEVVNETITDEEITSVGMDFKNNEIHIGYDRKTALGVVVQADVVYTISGQEVADSIARAEELARTGIHVQVAWTQAFYEQLPGNGVIS